MASNLSTVLYTSSAAYDKNETVFAGYSRLASHQLGDGVILNGDGFFTNVTDTADFDYQRPAPNVGPFTARSEPGTDIFAMDSAPPNMTQTLNASARQSSTTFGRSPFGSD